MSDEEVIFDIPTVAVTIVLAVIFVLGALFGKFVL